MAFLMSPHLISICSIGHALAMCRLSREGFKCPKDFVDYQKGTTGVDIIQVRQCKMLRSRMVSEL